jgi:DNA polymerase beta palm/DNA polymerase beta thumb
LLPGVQVVCCGSYRRGKATSGDCDILIAPPQGQEDIDILDKLISLLSEGKHPFLTDHLALPGSPANESKNGKATYMGVCRVDQMKPFRRIDIKTYPRAQFSFALLYFTGSDHFNRSMRYYAKRYKKLSLSDQGLTEPRRDFTGKKISEGPSRICLSEKAIFDALGLDYKEPWERNCFDDQNLAPDFVKEYLEARKDSDGSDDDITRGGDRGGRGRGGKRIGGSSSSTAVGLRGDDGRASGKDRDGATLQPSPSPKLKGRTGRPNRADKRDRDEIDGPGEVAKVAKVSGESAFDNGSDPSRIT